ncbi:MAG: prolipoprotein diacylglyceryl transferase [Candidatus Omnitrophota bacterium]
MYPVLWKIGNIYIYSYGCMVALGILVATYCCQYHAARRGLSEEKIVDLIFWVIIAGLIGGRLLYVLLNFGDYSGDLGEVFKLYKGGLVFHGGFIAGLIAAILFIKTNKMPFWKTLDLIVLYVPIGHAFGRIGCFLNGCCYGRETSLGLGIVFPGSDMCVHPTQLYSAVLLLILFVVLFFVERRKKYNGQIVFFYFILYGIMRFFMEFLRVDNFPVLGVLSIAQVISIGLLIAGIFFHLRFRKTAA